MSRGEARICKTCGVPVVDVRLHRRWHENVVTVRGESAAPLRKFIGDATDQRDDDDASSDADRA